MKRTLQWVLPGALVVVLDRAVKMLTDGVQTPLIPGLIALRSVRNTGMALGLFQGGVIPILLVSAALAAACIWLLRGMRVSGWAITALSLMAGGALGNMADRLFLGYVMDMLELLFVDFYIFNVADAGVVAGAVLCGWSLLFRPGDWSKKA